MAMMLNKKTAGGLIFAVLAALLFFSKTIYRYHMPQVSGTRPWRGALSKLEISSGIASWAETENIYASSGGAAGRVLVKEGDIVEQGQILFEMDFDVAAAERRLAETVNSMGKLQTDIQGLRTRLANIRQALASAGPEDALEFPAASGGGAAGGGLSGQAGIIALEIERSRLSLQNARLSFQLGSLSRNELTGAENALRSLFFKYQAEAEELELSLANKLMDLENLRLSQEASREALQNYRDNTVITAPSTGTILTLNVEKGKYMPENALLVSIGRGQEFTVDCGISVDNNFVTVGDSCELSNTTQVLTGTVTRVKPSTQGKTVSISVVSPEVSDGETFEITFSKDSPASFTLVPNSAINQDNDGYFLYQIKRRKGIMGEEYYLERLNIFIGDSDHQNTAVIRGITFFEPIVLASDKALSSGITVSLKNAEDFFEN